MSNAVNTSCTANEDRMMPMTRTRTAAPCRPDDSQNRLRQKQNNEVKQQHDQENNTGLDLLGNGVNIVFRQHNHRHDRVGASDRRNCQREDGKITAFFRRRRSRIELAEEHFDSEEEQNDAARYLSE